MSRALLVVLALSGACTEYENLELGAEAPPITELDAGGPFEIPDFLNIPQCNGARLTSELQRRYGGDAGVPRYCGVRPFDEGCPQYDVAEWLYVTCLPNLFGQLPLVRDR